VEALRAQLIEARRQLASRATPPRPGPLRPLPSNTQTSPLASPAAPKRAQPLTISPAASAGAAVAVASAAAPVPAATRGDNHGTAGAAREAAPPTTGGGDSQLSARPGAPWLLPPPSELRIAPRGCPPATAAHDPAAAAAAAVAQAAVAAVMAQLTGGGANHGTERAGDNHGTEPRPVQHAWASPAREGVITTGRASAREGAKPRQAHPNP